MKLTGKGIGILAVIIMVAAALSFNAFAGSNSYSWVRGTTTTTSTGNVSLENVAFVNQSNNFTKWQQIGKLFICDIDENTSVITVDETYARANCTNI